jgi:hypothetical protein
MDDRSLFFVLAAILIAKLQRNRKFYFFALSGAAAGMPARPLTPSMSAAIDRANALSQVSGWCPKDSFGDTGSASHHSGTGIFASRITRHKFA